MTAAPPTPGESQSAGAIIPRDERVLLDVRPGVMSVPLAPFWSVVILIGAASAGAWGLERMADAIGRGDRELAAQLRSLGAMLGVAGIGFVALRMLWQTIDWRCRRYIVTEKRVIRVFGVLRRFVADVPLRNVTHLTLHRSLGERLFGLGTIGINTSGTAWTEIHFSMVSRPRDVLDALRGAVERAGPNGEAKEPERSRPLVVGLAGGIGSGKSEVAAELAKLGALVIDSDVEAKKALERPEVRSRLVEWWGNSVIGADGLVDRKAIAEIVFRDAEQRHRLEDLVHPLVKAKRAELVARGAAAGTKVVVVDAPLLFEAGVNAECDTVVFVESPREQRAERVLAKRGWSEEELERREKAQLSLDEKRKRSDAIVINDSDRVTLAGRVKDLLERIQRSKAARPMGDRSG